jgi:hypothetical protein
MQNTFQIMEPYSAGLLPRWGFLKVASPLEDLTMSLNRPWSPSFFTRTKPYTQLCCAQFKAYLKKKRGGGRGGDEKKKKKGDKEHTPLSRLGLQDYER